MIHRIIRKLLYDSTSLRARVATRFYAEHAPERASGEYVIISEIGGEIFNSLENEIGTTNAIVQVDCYSTTTTKARELYEMVRNRMSGYRGDVTYPGLDGNDATDTVSITMLRKGMEVTDPSDASDDWKYGYSADFNVIYTHTIPTHT